MLYLTDCFILLIEKRDFRRLHMRELVFLGVLSSIGEVNRVGALTAVFNRRAASSDTKIQNDGSACARTRSQKAEGVAM